MIRVIIVDDHPIVRDGIASVLETEADIVVAASIGSAEEMLDVVTRDRPDAILLDLALPGMGGVEAISRLRQAGAPPVVIFSANEDAEAMVEAVRGGARGYVVKGAPGAEIVAAIREVAAGGSYFRGAAANAIAREVRSPRDPDGLTPREREVIRLVSEGLSNKQIAQRLGIAERTAKFHVRQIMSKLGADNRAQAVALATRRRLL
jgi:DNA-binding NarL/FixJ family response regulator